MISRHKINEIADLVSGTPSDDICFELFELFFTDNELEQLLARYDIIKGLIKRNETQRELSARLKLSIAKITRGSNELKRRSYELRSYLEAFLVDRESNI